MLRNEAQGTDRDQNTAPTYDHSARAFHRGLFFSRKGTSQSQEVNDEGVEDGVHERLMS